MLIIYIYINISFNIHTIRETLRGSVTVSKFVSVGQILLKSEFVPHGVLCTFGLVSHLQYA